MAPCPRWDHRSGTVQDDCGAVRREVKAALEGGLSCGCAKTAATCFEILKVEEALWTFVRVEGVEPTNNGPERALRHAVIWRRISGGTDSADGSRFVERMLTVVATCRQQNATCWTISARASRRTCEATRSRPCCRQSDQLSRLVNLTYATS